MPGRTDYEDRRQARIDRLNSASEKQSALSNEAYKRSHDLVKDIPFGQPNIEGRPALPRLRNKSIKALERAIEHDNKAGYYAGRAEAAESNTAVSSDNPDCLEKLRDKVEKLEAESAFAKRVNKYYRKYGTCNGCEGVTDEQARKLDHAVETSFSWETAPYPPYELTSIRQRIKAAQDRIKQLEKVDQMPEETIKFDGGKIISDPEDNRVKIIYNDKPSDKVRQRLKSNGFKWAPSNHAWQRLRTPGALLTAKAICFCGGQANG